MSNNTLGERQMRKAGGIIALIAGIFGIFAAGITLMVGGIGSAAQADGARMVVGLGWGRRRLLVFGNHPWGGCHGV
jgi:hypothetical protein